MLDRTRLPSRAGLAALAVFLVAGYLPLAAYAVSKSLGGNAKQESRNFAGSVLEVGDESLLPQEVGVWSRAAFETVSRDPDDPFGANSLVWTYTGMGLEVQFSVDGYYPSWHDLNYCYTGAGWQRSGGRNLGDAVVWTELDLFQEPSTYAVSMFSCFDSKLTPVKPPPVSGSKLRTVVNRLRAWNFIDDAAGQQVTPPVFQLQLFVKSGRELYPHEVDEIRKLYRRLSDDFVKAQANKK